MRFLHQKQVEVAPWPGFGPGSGHRCFSLRCPAGDSRIYYSGSEELLLCVTGLYYQGYLLGLGAVATKEISRLIKLIAF